METSVPNRKCYEGSCEHERCTCGHCRNYHTFSRFYCTRIEKDFANCGCKAFELAGLDDLNAMAQESEALKDPVSEVNDHKYHGV